MIPQKRASAAQPNLAKPKFTLLTKTAPIPAKKLTTQASQKRISIQPPLSKKTLTSTTNTKSASSFNEKTVKQRKSCGGPIKQIQTIKLIASPVAASSPREFTSNKILSCRRFLDGADISSVHTFEPVTARKDNSISPTKDFLKETFQQTLLTQEYLDSSPDRRHGEPSITPMFNKNVQDPCILYTRATNVFNSVDFQQGKLKSLYQATPNDLRDSKSSFRSSFQLALPNSKLLDDIDSVSQVSARPIATLDSIREKHRMSRKSLMDQFELLRMQARDTIELCGQQRNSCNDDMKERMERIENTMGQFVHEQVRTTQELELVAKSVHNKQQADPPQQQFCKEAIIETQNSSSELSTIIMEVTRPQTPSGPSNCEAQAPRITAIGADEQLLIHRQIEKLQKRRVPSRTKMAEPVKQEMAHEIQTLLMVVSRPDQTHDLKALKRQLQRMNLKMKDHAQNEKVSEAILGTLKSIKLAQMKTKLKKQKIDVTGGQLTMKDIEPMNGADFTVDHTPQIMMSIKNLELELAKLNKEMWAQADTVDAMNIQTEGRHNTLPQSKPTKALRAVNLQSKNTSVSFNLQ